MWLLMVFLFESISALNGRTGIAGEMIIPLTPAGLHHGDQARERIIHDGSASCAIETGFDRISEFFRILVG
jgi:hypothetical protein